MPDENVIDGVYTLKSLIGQGGMAEVYLAKVDLDKFDYTMLYAYTQVQGENHVERRKNAAAFSQELAGQDLDVNTVRSILKAHKIPLPGETVAVKLAMPNASMERFEAEWRSLVCLHHENVIQVYGGGIHERRPYYAMELLSRILSQQEIQEGFSLDQKLEFAIQAAEGLRYLHANGIIHRDVKPDNLLACGREDGGFVVKVSDLGIAKGAAGTSGMTMSQAVMGTPCYMSPEQVRSSKHVDERADIYSLGATLYKLVTRTAPYQEKTSVYEIISAISNQEPPAPAGRLSPDLPTELADIIQCSMAFDLEHRYANMDEMLHDLRQYQKLQAGDRGEQVKRTDDLTGATIVDADETEFVYRSRTAGELVRPTVGHEQVEPTAAGVAKTVTPAAEGQAAPTQGAAEPAAEAPAPTQVGAGAPAGRSRAPRGGLILAGAVVVLLLGALGAHLAGWLPPSNDMPAPPKEIPPEPVTPPDEPPALEDRFEERFARLQELAASDAAADLDAALDQAGQVLATARSEAERTAVNALLTRVRTQKAEAETAREYQQHLSAALTALEAGKLDQALASVQEAAALQKTEAVEGLRSRIQDRMRLQEAYDRAMARGREELAKKAWAEAEAEFAKALAVEGRADDEAAKAGLRNARKGRYAAAMETARQHAAQEEWPQAVAAFKAALAVEGYEEDPDAQQGIQAVGEGMRKAADAEAYAAAMAKARQLMDQEQFEQAAQAFQAVLGRKGRETDRAALEGLKRARAARFARTVKRAQQLLDRKQWREARAAFQAALAVEGYARDERALAGLAATRKAEQQAVWQSAPPPLPISEAELRGPGARDPFRSRNAVRRRIPDMRPDPPKLYGFFRP